MMWLLNSESEDISVYYGRFYHAAAYIAYRQKGSGDSLGDV